MSRNVVHILKFESWVFFFCFITDSAQLNGFILLAWTSQQNQRGNGK